MKGYKVVACVPMLIVFASIFIFCEKTPVEPAGLKELVGKWVIKELDVNGSVSSGGITIPMDTTLRMTNDNNFLEFYSTNTYRIELNEKLLSKTKSLKKVALLTDVFQASSDTGSWALTGNNLTRWFREATTLSLKKDRQVYLPIISR
jgi:hypothetical protein